MVCLFRTEHLCYCHHNCLVFRLICYLSVNLWFIVISGWKSTHRVDLFEMHNKSHLKPGLCITFLRLRYLDNNYPEHDILYKYSRSRKIFSESVDPLTFSYTLFHNWNIVTGRLTFHSRSSGFLEVKVFSVYLSSMDDIRSPTTCMTPPSVSCLHLIIFTLCGVMNTTGSKLLTLEDFTLGLLMLHHYKVI